MTRALLKSRQLVTKIKSTQVVPPATKFAKVPGNSFRSFAEYRLRAAIQTPLTKATRAPAAQGA
ncbi:uncharacterized protein KQ657_001584 [Scheffersomyces spartinae]|uniref:Uncharacterized protein n=1 Tax=Scheffersomyces spartinae TaxID=45513 RepID=A0A9P7V6W5_9ASCO|nr:uncharacterized protein KQ657_001584 [Scheffersomyces spartinae]KAG7192489.1 hypothetical protein KQ657_001584 [Scheffersomyces spartinae]